MKVIPAIDLIDGKCVRLKMGNYDEKTVYNASPIEQAKVFEDKGFSHLHLVDLDGAKTGKSVHLHILEEIAEKTALKIDFGGGLKSDKEETLKAGKIESDCNEMPAHLVG